MVAEMIVYNGRIYTMRVRNEYYDWMAVREGKVLMTGRTDDSYMPWVGENTELIDVKGLSVLPSFYDSHVHLVQSGLNSDGIDLLEVESIEGLLERVRSKTKTLPKGQLIRGYHFDVTKIKERRFPTRYEIDQVSPEHPVWINSIEYHTSAINSLALNIVNLPYNIDGIKRDERSLPLGYFTGKASAYIRNRLLATIDDSQREAGVRNRIVEAISKGVTTINAMEGGFTFHENDARFISRNKHRYPVDIRLFYQSFDLEKARQLGADSIGGDIFIDGAFNSRTAAVSKKYRDHDTCGNLYFNQEELNYFVTEVVKNEWQLSLHAIGDRAIEQTLNAFEASFGAKPPYDHRCRIEHFELANDDQIRRAKKLGMIISIQPAFEFYWGHPGGMYERRLDPSLYKQTNNFRKMIDAGLILCGGSDSDVTSINPILGIHSAVNHPKPLFGIDVYEAVEIFTKNSAFASFEENDKGTLEIGKKADFCILSGDIFKVDQEKIREIEVVATYKEGQALYCNDLLQIEVKQIV